MDLFLGFIAFCGIVAIVVLIIIGLDIDFNFNKDHWFIDDDPPF